MAWPSSATVAHRRCIRLATTSAGASLHSVYLDHVILDRGGTLETLVLPRLLPGMRGPDRARRGADPRTVAAVDNIRRMVQQDPGLLDQVMRTVASYDNAAGKLRGFRAYPGKIAQIFNKLGLKPGDLVTAINGTRWMIRSAAKRSSIRFRPRTT
jgi:general secretion pathway protein C